MSAPQLPNPPRRGRFNSSALLATLIIPTALAFVAGIVVGLAIGIPS